MQTKVSDAIRAGRVEGEGIVWFEDDDWFAPDWIEWCEKWLEQGYDLIGEGQAIYYNVNHRWWSNCGNVRHASLCQTAMRAKLLPRVLNIIEDFNCPWIDVQLWLAECTKRLRLPAEGRRRVIGIKGMPGTKGYSREHRQVTNPGNEPDYDLSALVQLIGGDAQNYEPYFAGADELMKLAGAYEG